MKKHTIAKIGRPDKHNRVRPKSSVFIPEISVKPVELNEPELETVYEPVADEHETVQKSRKQKRQVSKEEETPELTEK